MKESKDKLISIFARKFVGSQVDTGVIRSCLELLCDAYSFEGGFIYEITQNNSFYLQESFLYETLNLCEEIDAEEMKFEYYSHLEKKEFHYLYKNTKATKEELEMLQMFDATSLCITSIMDQSGLLQGMIVLLNIKELNLISQSDRELITIPLSMLSRYLSLRIYQNRLLFAGVSLEHILDNTGIDIYVTDFYTQDILYVNKAMAKPYGGASAFKGKKCWEVLFKNQEGPCEFCPQTKLIDEEGNPTKIYSWDYQRALDGAWFRVFSTAFRWINGGLAHVVSSADITDNKRNEELIKHLANYDVLTNLPNRRKLIDDCEQYIGAVQKKETMYILFFDIDGFKKINDTLGHDAGDEFLIKLAEFFKSLPALKDSIYRNGGDEFVAIVDKILTKEEIYHLGEIINRKFKEGWDLKKGKAFCGVSIGVASYPEHGTTVEELLYKADQAMYKIKKSGGHGVCFVQE